MSDSNLKWEPQYGIPPGWMLEDHLQARGYSQAEFAQRCNRSPKLISEIIAGKAPIEPATALQFEKVLGLNAQIWVNIESKYQLFLAREAEAKKAEEESEWVRGFPINHLVKRGYISQPKTTADQVSTLLAFFRIASTDAWDVIYRHPKAALRHSPSFKSDPKVWSTLLQIGVIKAEEQLCLPYCKSEFSTTVRRIRELTRKPLVDALNDAQKLCNDAGVGLVLVEPIRGAPLSGAAWWTNPKTAVIQLTGRYKSNDHLWFTFFHEAAHILLHSKKNIFLDASNDTGEADIELEAHRWAANLLIPPKRWSDFVTRSSFTEQEIKTFAKELGIATGIVVGRLQHEGIIDWSHFNDLKESFNWDDFR
ncbi:MAG: ImmA/IrrE family metallo-endopeptidase [Bacteroidetes bacterium]|nr:ImmA/IrrE family metallo-endopeptidase [Bacteroidota bacterium]